MPFNFKKITFTVLIYIFSLVYDKEIPFYAKLKNSLREKDAIKIINKEIISRNRQNTTVALELMNKRKWLEASRIMVDFLSDLNDPSQIIAIKDNIESYKTYLSNIKSVIKKKKKNIVKVSPVFEWSQDSKYVKMRVKFAKNLEAPGEIDIQDLLVNVTRTNFFISGYKVHEDYLVWYYRLIDLQANVKSHYTMGYKETDGTYIIRLRKETQTLYWSSLDQENQSHHNFFTWFEVFENYEKKAAFTTWKDITTDNLMDSDIEDYKRSKKEHQLKRIKRIYKNQELIKTDYSKNLNFCFSPIKSKKCKIPLPTEWAYWQV